MAAAYVSSGDSDTDNAEQLYCYDDEPNLQPDDFGVESTNPYLDKKYHRLSSTQKSMISDLIGPNVIDYHLLYKASIHGCNAKTFHEKCDNRGQTITVAYTIKGHVFGFYTTEPFDEAADGWVVDDDAFLFKLAKGDKKECNKYPGGVNVPRYILQGKDYGPTFGIAEGSYIMFFSGICGQVNQLIQSNIAVNNITQNTLGCDWRDISGNCKHFWDLEVYLVDQYYSQPEPGWRHDLIWTSGTKRKLSDFAKAFRVKKNIRLSKVNIALVGQVAAGKSSFYNTVHSAITGEIKQDADAGIAPGSNTKTYNTYKIRKSAGYDTLRFKFCDTMGIETDKGLDIRELQDILCGRIKDGYKFQEYADDDNDPGGRLPQSKKTSLRDEIHVAAIVVDISKLNEMSPRVAEKLREFKDKFKEKGIPYVLLATNIDRASAGVSENTTTVFHDSDISQCVDTLYQITGVPTNNILPIRNYENQTRNDEAIDILALSAVTKMLSMATDYFDKRLSQKKVFKFSKLVHSKLLYQKVGIKKGLLLRK